MERLNPMDLSRAYRHLRGGGVLAVPTETVYGLAADVENLEALAAVFRVKDRPFFDPLIVHTAPLTLAQLDERGWIDLKLLSPGARTQAERLREKLMPGPLTLLLPRGSKIPDLVTGGLSRVGIRMPSHPLLRTLLEQDTHLALAAPSANRFGRISPTSLDAVDSELGDRIPLGLEGGICTVGVESTVLGFRDDDSIEILRDGGTSREAIAGALGIPASALGTPKLSALASEDRAKPTTLSAPGTTESHYAPEARTLLLSTPAFSTGTPLHPDDLARLEALKPKRPSLLMRTRSASTPALPAGVPFLSIEVLVSSLGTEPADTQAARTLFAALRRLDASGSDLILIEPWNLDPAQAHGLDFAIQDRINRATAVRTHPPRSSQ